MDARLQRRIQRYGWDKASSSYEDYWSRQLAPAQRRLLKMAGLQPGERVLDIACGTGLITFPAALSVGAQGSIVATDISGAMVERGREESARRGLHNVTFHRIDAEAMDFPEHSFDAALCGLGLMYLPEPVNAMRRIRHILKPGGRFAAAVWGRRDRCGWAGIFPVVDSRVQSEVCPMFFQLGTGDNLGTALQIAGFSDIQIHRLAVPLEYPSAEDALGASLRRRPRQPWPTRI